MKRWSIFVQKADPSFTGWPTSGRISIPAAIAADAVGYAFEDYFIADYSTGEILPNPLASAVNQSRADKTIELYGLNIDVRKTIRKKELKHYLQRNPEASILDDFSYRYFLLDAS